MIDLPSRSRSEMDDPTGGRIPTDGGRKTLRQLTEELRGRLESENQIHKASPAPPSKSAGADHFVAAIEGLLNGRH